MTSSPHPVIADRRRFLALMGAGLAGVAATLAGCGDGAAPGSGRTGSAGSSAGRGSAGSGAPSGGSGSSPGGSGSTSGSGSPSGGSGSSSPAPPTGHADGGAVYVALRSSASRRSGGASGDAAKAAMGGFGLQMLRAVTKDHPTCVISPYSLYTVLAMARAGAGGRTGQQLDGILRARGVDAQGAVVTAVDHGVAAAVAATPGGDSPTVRTANQVWVQRGFRVRQQYLDALARQYGVQAVAAAFADAPDQVRQVINAWVAERTGGLIEDLFPDGSISEDTRLALVNALYLKAQWARPFSEPTGSEPFHTASGDIVHTPMMSAARAMPGVLGDGWTSVTVPYVGAGLAMTLLVPDAGAYAATLADADAALLSAAAPGSGRGAGSADASGRGDLRSEPVQLTLPPFRTRSRPDVLAAAEQLGVTDLFDPGRADLSGIDGKRDLFASSFVHQAVISVDENGTEAAAATGMGMDTTAIPAAPTELVVDRPFLYWIADAASGAPLFLGTVTDPTSGDGVPAAGG